MRTPLMEGGQGLAKTYGSGATVTWVQPSSTAVAKNSGMCCRSLLSTYSRPPSCLWSTDTLLGWFQWWKALKNSLLPRHQWQQKGPLCLPFKFNSNEIEERRKEFNFSLCILLSRCSRSMISPAIKVQMTQSDICTPACAYHHVFFQHQLDYSCLLLLRCFSFS